MARVAGMTVVRPAARLEISAEKGTPSARAIFHSTLMVGVLWPSSICPSMARLTFDAFESFSRERPRLLRRRRRLPPTTGVRSEEASAEAISYDQASSRSSGGTSPSACGAAAAGGAGAATGTGFGGAPVATGGAISGSPVATGGVGGPSQGPPS